MYVDIDDDMRLREDARPAFEKGLFLFSTAQPGWQARLHAFLDRPIADIQREWQAKADDRRELVQRYFDMGGAAGSRAANDITAYVGRMRAGDRTVAAGIMTPANSASVAAIGPSPSARAKSARPRPLSSSPRSASITKAMPRHARG